MILDKFIEWFFGVLIWAVSKFPVVPLHPVDGNNGNIYNLLARVGYFFDVPAIIAAIGVILTIYAAKGVIAIIRIFVLRF